MIDTVLDLSTSLLATLAFGLFLLPPAYLYLRGTNLLAFRQRSGPEQLLWTVTFSVPLTLFLCAVLGWVLPRAVLTAIFALAALAASLFVAPRLWQTRAALFAFARRRRAVLFAVALFTAYVLFMTCGVELHSRLYESTLYTDWSVRVPLVAGAIRDGVPVRNPFFTVHLQPQPSRYYFYWYVLCAEVARTTHLSARAALSASAVWSGFSLLALLFLLLRRLLGYRAASARAALLPLLLCCVMGLDVLAALLGYFLRPIIVFPEMEWWLDDRIPSFLGAVLFAPHHIGGVVCCTLAFLIVGLFRSTTELPPSGDRLVSPAANSSVSNSPLARPLAFFWTALTCGICFAASAGDSTYVALCFAFVGAFYALDLVLHARWSQLAVLAGGGAMAVLFSLPFLRMMAAPSVGGSTHHAMLTLAVRNMKELDHFTGLLVPNLSGSGRLWLGIALLPFFWVVQFGFLFVPLCMRVRTDWHRLRAGEPLSDGERLLWALFLGAAVPGFFLSSLPQGVNDLGRHAALILRLVLVVWAVPLLWPYFKRLQRRQPLSPAHPWLARVITALFLVSLLSQVWQIATNRLLTLVLDHRHLAVQDPVSRDSDLGARFFQLRRGLAFVENQLPANAVVQSNPGGHNQMPVMLYTARPFAAGDLSCELAFGGDPRACAPVAYQLERLFGSVPYPDYPAPVPHRGPPPQDLQVMRSLSVFERACHDLDLAAVVTQNSDLAWQVPDSWVWRMKPLYATPFVRIYGCPPYFPLAPQSPQDSPASQVSQNLQPPKTVANSSH